MSLLPVFQEHGPFIWAAYGIAALMLGGLTVTILARARSARETLDRLEREAELQEAGE